MTWPTTSWRSCRRTRRWWKRSSARDRRGVQQHAAGLYRLLQIRLTAGDEVGEDERLTDPHQYIRQRRRVERWHVARRLHLLGDHLLRRIDQPLLERRALARQHAQRKFRVALDEPP